MTPRTCACGSGEPPYPLRDGYGIFMCFTCDNCVAEKLSHFRDDIFTQYDTDEPITAHNAMFDRNVLKYGLKIGTAGTTTSGYDYPIIASPPTAQTMNSGRFRGWRSLLRSTKGSNARKVMAAPAMASSRIRRGSSLNGPAS